MTGTIVTSWGRLEQREHAVRQLSDRREATEIIARDGPGIAYGMGRSYGDVCLNPDGVLWKTTALDRYISLDEQTGQLVCEAGVLLRDLQRMAIPRGWMLPVTPGTQLATVGGAIANDVHGKNHHVMGTFGDHVTALTLARTTGEVIECGPHQESGWFTATVGGLGLTGVILMARIQLRRVAGPWLDTESVAYNDLGEFFDLSDAAEKDSEYTVSWIDCLSGRDSRGIFMRGNHAAARDMPEPKRRLKKFPFVPPVSLVNALSLRCFNSVYFRLKKWQAGSTTSHYEPFFYPLDGILDWNRIYGPQGFYQHQSVVPREGGQAAISAMLAEIAKVDDGSFLAVLKTFGEKNPLGLLSFPRPGVTLALDFTNRGARTLRLLDSLDAIVCEHGGRIYPAKDARMSRNTFEAGYPRIAEFLKYRDPGISSQMSRRLMGN